MKVRTLDREVEVEVPDDEEDDSEPVPTAYLSGLIWDLQVTCSPITGPLIDGVLPGESRRTACVEAGFKDEQIIGVLREADAGASAGTGESSKGRN